MGNTSWICGACGLGNVGRSRCAECGRQRSLERSTDLLALLGEPDHQLARPVVKEAPRVLVPTDESDDEDVVFPRKTVGARTVEVVFGIVSAATTVVILVVFSFFVGIVAQAFM